MMSELVKKEIMTTLRDKKVIISTIIMPIIIFTVMGAIYGFAFSAVAQQAKHVATHARILVCDMDKGPVGAYVVQYARNHSSITFIKNQCTLREIAEGLSSNRYDLAVIVPEGASANFTSGKPVLVKVFTKAAGVSMASSVGMSLANAFVDGVNDFLRSLILKSAGLNPEFTVNPVKGYAMVLFRGRFVPPQALASLFMVSFTFVMAPLIVIVTALGFASTSMATENEEKTLEVLLSLPIPRIKIVLSKLAGTLVVAALATASFTIGMLIYTSMVFGAVTTSVGNVSSSTPGSTVGAAPQAFNSAALALLGMNALLIMVVGTFLSLLAVASLGLLLGSFAPSVRASSTFTGQLSFLVMIPGFLLMFLSLSSLGPVGIGVLIALSPFITPIVAMKAYIEGITWAVPASLGWSIAFSIMMILIAAKLLDSERLLNIQYSLLSRGTRRKRKGVRFRLRSR